MWRHTTPPPELGCSLILSDIRPTTGREPGEDVKLVMKATAIFDGIIGLLMYLAATLIAFLMLAISTDVFLRYFMTRTFAWVVQFSEHIMVYITFLGAAWVLKREGHVKVDLVLNRLNPKTQSLLNISTSIIGLGTFLVLTWYTGQCTWDYFQKGISVIEAVKVPKSLVLGIIPIGCFLLSIQFMRRSYGYFRSRRSSPSKEQGTPY